MNRSVPGIADWHFPCISGGTKQSRMCTAAKNFLQWKHAALCFVLSVGFIFCAAFSAVGAQSITLAWDPSPDPDVTGYTVYYGSASGVYANRVPVGDSTSVTVSNLQEAVTYFFVVTASDSSGQESPPSNEVSYTVPGVVLKIGELHLPGFPPALVITSIGTAPPSWVLEESSDLRTWQPVATGIGVAVQVSVEIGDAPQRFFRLRGE